MAHLAQFSASSCDSQRCYPGKAHKPGHFLQAIALIASIHSCCDREVLLSLAFFGFVCGPEFMNLSKVCLNLLVFSPSTVSSESRFQKFTICCTVFFNLCFKSLLKRVLFELTFFLLLQDLVNTVLPSPWPS